MPNVDPDWSGVMITVVVVVITLFVGIQVMGTMAGQWDDAVCEQKLGKSWDYVNGTENEENQTVVCIAPNGTTERVDRELNLTSVTGSLS